jgi:hypothetical protein
MLVPRFLLGAHQDYKKKRYLKLVLPDLVTLYQACLQNHLVLPFCHHFDLEVLLKRRTKTHKRHRQLSCHEV